MTTALKCDCHGEKTMAFADPEEGVIEVQTSGRDRHVKTWSIHDVVRLLDPRGTSYAPVGSNGTA